MEYEAPEVVTIGEIASIVRGGGNMSCECGSRLLFDDDDLLDILDEN